jgi:hypothetical protein
MNPKVAASITAALLAAVGGAAWWGLRPTECRDISLVCDWSEKGEDIIESPHEEVVTVRGDRAPEKADPGGLRCKVAKVGEVYACSSGDPITRQDESKLNDGCACSDGSAGCEVLDDKGKWKKADKGPLNLSQGQWRGTCVPKQCVEHAEMISGVGAVNPLSYSSPVACNGPGKTAPSGGRVPDALVQAAKAEAGK